MSIGNLVYKVIKGISKETQYMKQLQWKPKPQLFFICLYVIVALQEAGNNRDILSTFQGLKCRWDKWVKSRAKSYSSRTITEFVDRRQKCWGWSEHDKLCPESNSYSIVRDRNKNTSSPQSFGVKKNQLGRKAQAVSCECQPRDYELWLVFLCPISSSHLSLLLHGG